MTDKGTLRRLAKLLSPSVPEEGHRVVRRLAELIGEVSTGCVYLPIPGELDATGVVAHRADIDWFTTRTVDRATLTVHAFESELEMHPFGYRQPVSGSPEIEPDEIDAWIVPGVAFDAEGHRLGHGMGYYDRLLSRARTGALLIGVTTERRVFPRIPYDRFDISMDAIVTEERVINP